MYKLKYSLLLTVAMYGTSTLAMTSRATQLGRRAAASTSQFTPGAATTFNRPFATSTAPVVPTWQQTPTAQQAASRMQPFTADSFNRSLLKTQQSSYKNGSEGSSFYDRYKKGGLMAALASFWATNKAETKEMSDEEKMAELRKKIDDVEREQVLSQCDEKHQRIELYHLGSDLDAQLQQIRRDYPKCAGALNASYSAKIDFFKEELRQLSKAKDELHWRKEQLPKWIAEYEQLQNSLK